MLGGDLTLLRTSGVAGESKSTMGQSIDNADGSIEVLFTASQIAKEMLYISSVSGIEGDASVSITL